MCDNLEGMRTVSPNAMLQPKGFNARVPCSSLPEMDLTAWKHFDGRQGENLMIFLHYLLQ